MIDTARHARTSETVALLLDTPGRRPTSPPPHDMGTNCLERWDAYVVQIAAPGADASSITVDVQGRTLTVRGRTRAPYVEGSSTMWRTIPQGEFVRTVDLPEAVDADRADAYVENGILGIELPKVSHLRAAAIPVHAYR